MLVRMQASRERYLYDEKTQTLHLSDLEKRATGIFPESPAWEAMNSRTCAVQRRGVACLFVYQCEI